MFAVSSRCMMRGMKRINGEVGRDVPIAPVRVVCVAVRRDEDIAPYLARIRRAISNVGPENRDAYGERSNVWSTTQPGRDPGRSILLTTTIALCPSASALRVTKRVCGIGPSTASTI